MSILPGLNGATISNANLETGIRAATDAGFPFYEPRVPLLLDCEEKGIRDRALSTLRRSGLTWLPLNALEGLFALEPAALITRADSVFSLAERFGVTQVIVVPEKPSREITLSIASDTLSRLVDHARLYGASLLYELIGFPSHAFPSLTQAYVVVTNVGIPLVFDTFHLAVSRTDPQEIASFSPEASGLVHLSDALIQGKVPEELEDQERVLPGEGGLSLIDLLTTISKTDCCGPASAEVFRPKYGAHDPRNVAREAYQQTRAVLQVAGCPS